MEHSEEEEAPARRPLSLECPPRYQDYLHITAFEHDNYFEASEEKAFDATPDSGIHEIGGVTDPEQKAKLEDEWKIELAKTEEEIATLRQVLSVKVKYAQDLKRKLGITPWKELKDDVEQSLRNIQETPAMKEVGGRLVEWNSAITSAPIYQRTSQTVKTAAEKTTSVLGVLGASVSKKLGEVKNSSTFRSFEERMGSAYTNVRSRMGTPRSTSLYNFDDAVRAPDRRGVASSASTPTIPERGPIP
ncbi:tumor protein D54-like isoform X2 [Argiope bruennichi]|uniref:Tumor protein D54 like protein n=1 Tax=Argiope bruennichi TaxID=94029 RepID=A0A8T0F2B0_ARGBR|nr:tumor protein D54-like isoform X2 [Argiope bruennichi]KAF8785284.1 Tumor protein D54 like protein [Argiope bruennichi]